MVGRVRPPLNLVLRRHNEKENAHPSDFVEESRTAQDQAYTRAREQLRKTTERNKKKCDKTVSPVKLPVDSIILYCRPRRYVGRLPKMRHINSAPFLVDTSFD